MRGKSKGTRVLGRETLTEIWNDMERMGLPSWVAPAPHEPGTARHGKFSADQWRTFCTINLVFSLIRLWGREDKDSRKHRMLANFMDLITAVKIAHSRTMTPSRISQYEFHMHRYMVTLLELYPGTRVAPNQHLSLHYGSLLRQFGPTHAWRSFAFERYNYFMQKTKTNMKFGVYEVRDSQAIPSNRNCITGELEQTMFNRFCMTQNLRSHLHQQQIPPEAIPLILAYNKAYESDIRGTLLNDNYGFDDAGELDGKAHPKHQKLTTLPIEYHRLLKQWISDHDPNVPASGIRLRGLVHTEFRRFSQVFQTAAASPRDSCILYQQRNPSELCAGRIRDIFSHTRYRNDGSEATETFFVVDPYQALSHTHTALDWYRLFPTVGGHIHYAKFLPDPVIITGSEVVCHVALTECDLPGVEEPCVHTLPLDKVRGPATGALHHSSCCRIEMPMNKWRHGCILFCTEAHCSTSVTKNRFRSVRAAQDSNSHCCKLTLYYRAIKKVQLGHARLNAPATAAKPPHRTRRYGTDRLYVRVRYFFESPE